MRHRHLQAAIAGLGAAALLLSATAAFAAAPTLFGGATMGPNAARLVSITSDASPANDFSGIDFTLPASTTLSALTHLSATYNVLGTDCAGGSPRFQINVQNGTSTIQNIFAYLGPEPNYTGCPQNTATTSGNVLSNARKIDTSQLPGGTFYDTYSHLLSAYGNYTVTGIQLVVDAGWSQPNGLQQVAIGRARIGQVLYDFGTNATSSCDRLIRDLRGLTAQYPDFASNIQALIDQLNAQCHQTTPPPPMPPPAQNAPRIDNDGTSVGPGGNLDFVGRSFAHEENVTLTLNGSTLRTVHADGGGNFSTGSMSAPTTPGTYNYLFKGTTGDMATSTITVTGSAR